MGAPMGKYFEMCPANYHKYGHIPKTPDISKYVLHSPGRKRRLTVTKE